MYCPKCGKDMEQINGVWTCRRGDMPLSERVSAAFVDTYVLKIRANEHKRTALKWGGVWYCPGCGVRLQEQDGLLACRECGRSLNEFLYDLIELHPHKNEPGN
jgi:predicted amidophosphoribosyltransferase